MLELHNLESGTQQNSKHNIAVIENNKNTTLYNTTLYRRVIILQKRLN